MKVNDSFPKIINSEKYASYLMELGNQTCTFTQNKLVNS